VTCHSTTPSRFQSSLLRAGRKKICRNSERFADFLITFVAVIQKDEQHHDGNYYQHPRPQSQFLQEIDSRDGLDL
jgi:hypothetical protein